MNASHDRISRIARQTWWSFVGVEVACLLITLSALADTLFHLGWGYDWKTIPIGLGISIWGGVVWIACRTIFRGFDAQ